MVVIDMYFMMYDMSMIFSDYLMVPLGDRNMW